MADIALIKNVAEAGVIVAQTAITPAGDAIPMSKNGKRKVLLFVNGHSSSITVALVSQLANQTIKGFGKVQKANVSLAIPAGQAGAFLLTDDELGPYLDGAGKVQISYTGGNAAMKLTAIEIA